MLDDGPDTVELWPAVEGADSRGNISRLPTLGPPVVLERVWMRPAPDGAGGYLLIGRVFPAGLYSRVAWNGRDFDLPADPVRASGGPTSLGHVRVKLAQRAPEPADG